MLLTKIKDNIQNELPKKLEHNNTSKKSPVAEPRETTTGDGG